MQHKFSKFLIINVIYTLLSIVLLIYLVGDKLDEAEGIFLYVILGSLGALLWLIYFIVRIWKEFKNHMSKKHTK